jgi:hypothetical protein
MDSDRFERKRVLLILLSVSGIPLLIYQRTRQKQGQKNGTIFIGLLHTSYSYAGKRRRKEETGETIISESQDGENF